MGRVGVQLPTACSLFMNLPTESKTKTDPLGGPESTLNPRETMIARDTSISVANFVLAQQCSTP